MGLCKLPNYNVGGTIHFITNNNVGFTTSGKDSRSSRYASGISNAFEIPVLHVNTFDVDSLIKTCKFAVRYWQTYRKDIMLDMIGFRKYGHNEVDEPSFT
jgi:2-oxoglutarate dehydrogenase complex dehydrogenase (E1) component-like enzyme